jgi:hypothetical protein
MLLRTTLYLHSAQKELRAVGARTSIGHGQNARASVLQCEVLISELGSVDGFTTSTIAALLKGI